MIRPFVSIKQDLAVSSPNLLQSLMKGVLIGTSVQDENDFEEKLSLTPTYGSLKTILSDISSAAKNFYTAGLINGAKLNINSLSFGSLNAVGSLEFGDKEYTGTTPDTTKKYIITLDTGDTKVGKQDLISAGAENGDEVIISFTDTDGNDVVENHKIRLIEISGTDINIHLWNEIESSKTDDTTSFSLEELKKFSKVKLDILPPLSITRYGNSLSSYVLDNTSNPTDGGFSADYFVYTPINESNFTFDDIIVSTEKLSLDSYSETVKTIRISDGDLINFFVADRIDLSNNIFEVSTNDYKDKLGKPSKRNTLSYAMQLISREIPGAVMKVYVVESDNDVAYIKALDVLMSQKDIYSVTPLTDSDAVISSTLGMIKKASGEYIASFKMGIVSPRTSYYSQKILTSDSTIELISSDLYKLTLTNGGLLKQNVKVGDFLFSEQNLIDAKASYYNSQNETYSENAVAIVVDITTDKEAVVRSVIPGDNIADKLASSSISIGSINKNNNLVEATKLKAQSFGHKDFVSIFPDKYSIKNDGKDELIEGYYVAALLNAIISHLPPQQGISNLSINSISRTYGGSFEFSDDELDSIASSGNLVILQQNLSAAPYILRQVTTDTRSLERMEINKVRCLDYASLELGKVLDSFVGKRNISTTNADEIKSLLVDTGRTIIESSASKELGSIITYINIKEVKIPENEKDAVNAYIEVETPTSMNKIRLFISSGK